MEAYSSVGFSEERATTAEYLSQFSFSAQQLTFSELKLMFYCRTFQPNFVEFP